jgi:hypothetical protein
LHKVLEGDSRVQARIQKPLDRESVQRGHEQRCGLVDVSIWANFDPAARMSAYASS